MKLSAYLVTLLPLLLSSEQILAYENLPNTGNMPDVVTLRLDCSATNPDLKNCSSTISEMLNWVWTIRNPGVTNPLLVDIGPGTFTVPSDTIFCANQGNVTFRGSGQDNTVITGGYEPTKGAKSAVMYIESCDSLTFSDMTIRSDSREIGAGTVSSVVWVGDGSSDWTSVNLEASKYGWADNCFGSQSSATGDHYFYASKIDVQSVGSFPSYMVGYQSGCAESWFFGGEITVLATGTPVGAQYGVRSQGLSKVLLFGTAVRSIAGPNAKNLVFSDDPATGLGHHGLMATNNGTIHMHGGIVNSTANLTTGIDYNLNGAVATTNGFIHTPGTAYNIVAGGNGTAARVVELSGGVVKAPYIWPKESSPIPGLVSTTGSDMFVETDCDASGDCSGNSTNPQHPHLMIYDAACTGSGGTWYNIATNSCRQ